MKLLPTQTDERSLIAFGEEARSLLVGHDYAGLQFRWFASRHMTIGGTEMRKFVPAQKRVDVSPGESVRIIRELQGLSQTQLSSLCGIPQTTISSIENSRVNLGVERAKVLATALHCHPAVLVFPGWQLESAA
jgi:DNA-binding XRE family transcriptional regulator